MADEKENKESSAVEVTWSGKTLFIERSMLEQWYNASYEMRDYWVSEHPWIAQKIPIHHFSKPGESKPQPEVDMSNYVIVHFSGKSLILPRAQLEQWYSDSPEDRATFIGTHPEAEIKF